MNVTGKNIFKGTRRASFQTITKCGKKKASAKIRKEMKHIVATGGLACVIETLLDSCEISVTSLS